jgi:hypothetical protein
MFILILVSEMPRTSTTAFLDYLLRTTFIASLSLYATEEDGLSTN